MNVVFAESRWLWPAVAVFLMVAVLVGVSYVRAQAIPRGVRAAAATLKLTALALLLLLLLDPQVVRSTAVPQSNWVAVVADTSASMEIADQSAGGTRSATALEVLGDAGWLAPLEERFQIRRFAFDRRARRLESFDGLRFSGSPSALRGAIEQITAQFAGQPLAAIVVVTDGAGTDLDGELPAAVTPVFPALVASERPLVDAAVERVESAVSAFETAPVTVDVTIRCRGATGRMVTARLHDEAGAVIEEKRLTSRAEDDRLTARFLARPEKPGPAAYRVELTLEGDAIPQNNAWNIVADRESGARRVLYVSGAPNWEHRFLQRAVAADPELQLTSLVRIARGAPRFGAGRADRANPLYQGHGAEEAERFDEAVYLRLGTQKPGELRSGFPRRAEELFAFDAVILDQIDDAFFSHDQLTLLRNFVANRGGSLVVLGGLGSFELAGNARSPLADVLPVYLGAAGTPAPPFRVELTREGSLRPWLRLRAHEAEEAARVAEMPPFFVAHALTRLKPGAEALLTFTDAAGRTFPALAAHRFGHGLTLASPLGDWWRWGMPDPGKRADLERFWRQLLRGSLADVPRRARLMARPVEAGLQELELEALGPDFRPAEDARVTARVRRPDGEWTPLDLRADPEHAGRWEARVAARASGPWLAEATVTDAADGTVTRVVTGWAVNGDAEEFREPLADRGRLESLVRPSGGRVLMPGDLRAVVEELQRRPAPVMETRSEPLWHHAIWLTLALGCLGGEWALRRWKGLA